ncbi:glycosyl transferase family 2 [Rhodococcus rhodochrous ATCC 21198]|nr:glycosyltransferase family 2 protein [Rhodococcus aetherivorans]ETT24121.1 glycosyl transferase family 2 [Rhodococcus rhodochrous ATCC 21198]NGP28898.1 glycosyltransferase family 2 protein [Rhodococcus aetherivorans]
MPTFNRRRFVPDAIESFRLQTYRSRELVIVDDGTDPVGDLVPDNPTIRYVHLQQRLSTGEKRNAACRAARGKIIVHWDDDDWSSPDRVDVQVSALLESGADICGMRELLFYDPAADRGWRYRYPPRARPWVAGGTMCYRRSLWEAHPFPDVRQGEDTRFVWSSRSIRVHTIERLDLYVATIHQANTSAKRTSGSRWVSVPIDEILAVMGEAAHRYRSTPVHPVAGCSSRITTRANRTRTPSIGCAAPDMRADAAHVTVSIPHHGPNTYLRAAAESVLAQTHNALTCVVISDGDPADLDVLADIDDARLVRYTLAEHHGRCFADQVVLDAISSPYYLVHDSDEWSAPTRVERLLSELERTGADVCLSDVIHHDRRTDSMRTWRHGWPRLHDPVGPHLVHRARYQGLYRAEIVRRIGGWYAGHRVGFDAAVLDLVLIVGGRITSIEEPLYHRNVRNGVFHPFALIARNTPERSRATRELRELYRRAYEATTVHRDHDAASHVRRLVTTGRSADAESALRSEAAILAARLPSRIVARVK